MKVLSVFEYGRIEPLTGTEKNLLDQLRGPRNERLFDVGWRETRATSFVGAVQLPQTTLQVLPKMYRRDLEGTDEPPARPSAEDSTGDPAGRPYRPGGFSLVLVLAAALIERLGWSCLSAVLRKSRR